MAKKQTSKDKAPIPDEPEPVKPIPPKPDPVIPEQPTPKRPVLHPDRVTR